MQPSDCISCVKVAAEIGAPFDVPKPGSPGSRGCAGGVERARDRDTGSAEAGAWIHDDLQPGRLAGELRPRRLRPRAARAAADDRRETEQRPSGARDDLLRTIHRGASSWVRECSTVVPVAARAAPSPEMGDRRAPAPPPIVVPTPVPLAPGTRVDRYEVLELLGSGGMGEVYRARDPKLARLVALKILRADAGLGSDGAAAARLLREARAVAALSHANVLAVFDVGEVQEPESLRGLAYIAMELVVGQLAPLVPRRRSGPDRARGSVAPRRRARARRRAPRRASCTAT